MKMKGKRYQNIHTKIVSVVSDEIVVGNPPIDVVILDSGVRWERKQFFKHHTSLILPKSMWGEAEITLPETE